MNRFLEYEITTVTGRNQPFCLTIGSGNCESTDANVFVTLFGSGGSSDAKIPLTKSGTNLFQVGQTDVFNIEAADIGELFMIRIEHDNSGNNPAWFLVSVTVKNLQTQQLCQFACNRWFAVKWDDHKISRDLVRPFCTGKGFE